MALHYERLFVTSSQEPTKVFFSDDLNADSVAELGSISPSRFCKMRAQSYPSNAYKPSDARNIIHVPQVAMLDG